MKKLSKNKNKVNRYHLSITEDPTKVKRRIKTPYDTAIAGTLTESFLLAYLSLQITGTPLTECQVI